jgi:hypothetical protein
VLKKLTATGILAGAATGVVLLGGPAHADGPAPSPSVVSDPYPAACYYTAPGYVPPAWCANYPPPAYPPPAYPPPAYPPAYPPPTYYAPITYYPGHGWNRWQPGGWGRYPHHWHR